MHIKYSLGTDLVRKSPPWQWIICISGGMIPPEDSWKEKIGGMIPPANVFFYDIGGEFFAEKVKMTTKVVRTVLRLPIQFRKMPPDRHKKVRVK